MRSAIGDLASNVKHQFGKDQKSLSEFFDGRVSEHDKDVVYWMSVRRELRNWG